MSRETCVFVTPALPSRTGSGLQQRAFAWLVGLARDSDVTLVLALLPGSADAAKLQAAAMELLPYVQRIEICPVSLPPKLLRAMALVLPWLLRWWAGLADDWLTPKSWSPNLPGAIDRLILFRMRTLLVGKAIERRSRVASVAVDLDDVESETLVSISRRTRARGFRKFALHLALASRQYKILEGACCGELSQVYLSSPCDVAVLERVAGSAAVHVRPNRVWLSRRQVTRFLPDIFRLVFVGTLDYFPNVDAVRWIAEEIIPAMRRFLTQGFEVMIVGRGASPELLARLAQTPEIRFAGEVPDLTTVYAMCHASLAAVRCGGGTKLKVLEAIAQHCPVIATTHALRGLPFLPGLEVCVADTGEAIAAACRDLLADPVRTVQMSRDAYNTLLKKELAMWMD